MLVCSESFADGLCESYFLRLKAYWNDWSVRGSGAEVLVYIYKYGLPHLLCFIGFSKNPGR